jgi:hypothetical protein
MHVFSPHFLFPQAMASTTKKGAMCDSRIGIDQTYSFSGKSPGTGQAGKTPLQQSASQSHHLQSA